MAKVKSLFSYPNPKRSGEMKLNKAGIEVDRKVGRILKMFFDVTNRHGYNPFDVAKIVTIQANLVAYDSCHTAN